MYVAKLFSNLHFIFIYFYLHFALFVDRAACILFFLFIWRHFTSSQLHTYVHTKIFAYHLAKINDRLVWMSKDARAFPVGIHICNVSRVRVCIRQTRDIKECNQFANSPDNALKKLENKNKKVSSSFSLQLYTTRKRVCMRVLSSQWVYYEYK